MAGKYGQKIKEDMMTAVKNDDLGFLFYKDPAVTGYDPMTAGEEDYNSLSAMNAAAGIAVHEFDGAGYARQALAYVGGGTGVVRDDANNIVKLIPDDYEFAALSASGAGGTPGVGGVIVFTNHSDPDDTTKFVVNIIPYATPQQPNGGAFPVNWPANGCAYIS